MINISTGNINVVYNDKNGVKVGTGYATLTDSIEIHISITDRVKYEADKDNIDAQEKAFRSKVIAVADIFETATIVDTTPQSTNTEQGVTVKNG